VALPAETVEANEGRTRETLEALDGTVGLTETAGSLLQLVGLDGTVGMVVVFQ
jgi:hypothetical protein